MCLRRRIYLLRQLFIQGNHNSKKRQRRFTCVGSVLQKCDSDIGLPKWSSHECCFFVCFNCHFYPIIILNHHFKSVSSECGQSFVSLYILCQLAYGIIGYSVIQDPINHIICLIYHVLYRI